MSSTTFLSLCVLAAVVCAVSAAPWDKKNGTNRWNVFGDKAKDALSDVAGNIQDGAKDVFKWTSSFKSKQDDTDGPNRWNLFGDKAKDAISDAASDLTDGAKDVFKWASSFKSKQDHTVEKQAEILLQKTETAKAQGQELVNNGQKLLKLADDMEAAQDDSDTVDKRQDAAIQLDSMDLLSAQESIESLRQAGQLSIDTGNKIIASSDKLADALAQAGTDLAEVVRSGLKDVGTSMKNVGTSLAKAQQAIQMAMTSSGNVNMGFGDALVELQKTGQAVLSAVRSFQDLGRNTLTLARDIFNLGKNVFQVMRTAATNIRLATGIQGRR